MTLTEERCPTCDGSGFVARNGHRSACPTCSPTSSVSAPYVAPSDPDQSSALRILRWAAYLVGTAALVAVLALLIKQLWK
jgi:ribosomal protein S27AE